MMVTILFLLGLPALGKMQSRSQRVSCANNLRQISLALLAYSTDCDDYYPPRRFLPAWPAALAPYFQDLRVLVCPSDLAPTNTIPVAQLPADLAPRSYLFNGWNDFYASTASGTGNLQNAMGMPASSLPYPAETITFGEKDSFSGSFYMDCSSYGDAEHHLNQARHGGDHLDTQQNGSNYSFVDGSVRFLRYGESFLPVNRWACTDDWRFQLVPVFLW